MNPAINDCVSPCDYCELCARPGDVVHTHTAGPWAYYVCRTCGDEWRVGAPWLYRLGAV